MFPIHTSRCGYVSGREEYMECAIVLGEQKIIFMAHTPEEMKHMAHEPAREFLFDLGGQELEVTT